VVVLLAAKVIESGERLLVVSAVAAQRAALSQALWAREGTFLAHGEAGQPHAARQPILLSEVCEAANGARTAILADGSWREEAAGFDRSILLFGPERAEAARALWSALSGSGQALRIFKQGESGGWREGR
jgi:DNA polymerase-3 subunit chi